MLDYRRNDLFDKLYRRYLESFEITLETEEITGSAAYKYILDYIQKSFKLDVKNLDIEVKQYTKFMVLKRKFLVKLENLEEKLESFSNLPKKKWYHRIKLYFLHKSIEKIDKKYKKALQKYRYYLPEDWFLDENNDIVNDENKNVVRTDVGKEEEKIQQAPLSDDTVVGQENLAIGEADEIGVGELKGVQLEFILDKFFTDETQVDSELKTEV